MDPAEPGILSWASSTIRLTGLDQNSGYRSR